jgi:hypothetical protein
MGSHSSQTQETILPRHKKNQANQHQLLLSSNRQPSSSPCCWRAAFP